MYQDIIQQALRFIDKEWVKEHSVKLNLLERSSANDDFLASTDYVLGLMKEAGFSAIERYAIPCDGVTTSDDCTMPLAWNRSGRSTLEIVSPEKKLLADSDLQPISSVIWSAPTPPGGVTAELISRRSLKSGDWHEAAGKIVLWDNSPNGQEKVKLARSGALGIAAFVDSIYDTNPDDVRWMNGVGLKGWYYTKEDEKTWVFSITPRHGRELEARLAAGEKIILKAVMVTKVEPGEIYTVTGVIPGKSDEEMALVAHMYEPFVPDDAAGVLLSLAVGKALKEMAEQGIIPPLEKTLRVIFSMERYGFSEYFLNAERRKKIISTINMDSICHATLKEAGTLPVLRSSPASAPYFETVLMRNFLQKDFPELPFEKTPGNLSDDTFMADKPYHIPCSWLFTPPAPGRHHNTGAVFAAPDWEIGFAVTAVVTAFHAKVNAAAAGSGSNELLQEIIEGVKADAVEDFNRLATAVSDYDRAVIGSFLVSYHTQRITAFNRFVPGAADEKAVTRMIEEIREALVPAVSSTPVAPADPLAGMTVTRAEGFSQLMSFAKVPLPERYTVLRHPEMLHLALLDGKHSCYAAFIISNFFLQRTPSPDESGKLAETFRFLAQYGYWSIK